MNKLIKIEMEREQEYQRKLLEEAKKAEAANRAKTEFLQRMSYNICSNRISYCWI